MVPKSMLLLLLLSACCLPFGDTEEAGTAPDRPAGRGELVHLPPAPQQPGRPDASLAARPRWAEHHGYAPQGPAELVDLGTAVEGPVAGGLVACTVTSYVREARLRKVAANPDLQATLSFGRTEIFAAGPDNVATLSITAPLASLAPGDILRIEVQDRQVFRNRALGTLETGYVGLPVELDADSLRGRCAWVPGETVEARLEAPLQQARRDVSAWQPTPSLEDDSLRPAGHGASAFDALHAAAALVGWADPRVQALAARYDEGWDAHHRALAVAARQRAASLPTGQVAAAPGMEWAPARVVPGKDVSIGLAHVDWRVELPLVASTEASGLGDTLGPLSRLELVDAAGSHWGLSVQGIVGPDDQLDLAGNLVGPGRAILAPTAGPHDGSPAAPALLRARTDAGWIFQRVETGP